MTDFEKLAQRAKELADKATKGPWHVVERPWRSSGMDPWVIAGHHDPHIGKPVADTPMLQDDEEIDRDADMDFIAGSRTLVPELAEAVLFLLDTIRMISPYPEPEYREKYLQEMIACQRSERRLKAAEEEMKQAGVEARKRVERKGMQ